MRLTRSAADHSGLLVSGATRGSATISAAVFSPCDHSQGLSRRARYSNAAFAIRARDGGSLSHVRPRRQFVPARRESSDRSRVPTSAMHPRRQLAHFSGQAFSHPAWFPRHFIARLIHQAPGFARCGALRFIDDFVRRLPARSTICAARSRASRRISLERASASSRSFSLLLARRQSGGNFFSVALRWLP